MPTGAVRRASIALSIACLFGALLPSAVLAVTLPVIVPDGDGSRDAAIQIRPSGATLAFDTIDETIAAADTTTYLQNQQRVAGRYHALLQAMPADFTTMSTLSVTIRARTVGVTDDRTSLFAQLVMADELTPLSAEVLVATNPGSAAWATSAAIPFGGLVGGSKATWDGARLRLRWAYEAVGAGDATQLRLSALELRGTYATGSPPVDTDPPGLSAASVNGAALTLTYDEPLDGGSVPAAGAYAVLVNASGRAVTGAGVGGSVVTLTLASPVISTDTVSLSYTAPATNPVQDPAGNDAPAITGQAVTNATPPPGDTDPPGLSAASVNGAALRLTYDEPLDGGSVPSAGAYAVLVNASGRAVSGVGIAGSVVTLTLSSSVVSTDTVTVSYTAGTPPVQDVAGNDAPAFTSQAVTNATPPPPPPGGATLPVIVPDGDGSRDAAIQIRPSGATLAFDTIDETIAAADTTTYLQNQQRVAGRYHALLQAMPADFTTMSTLSVTIRARTVGVTDDRTSLFAQLVMADELTPLSAEVLVATNPGSAAWATSAAIPFGGLVGGSKATWDGARLRLRWAYEAVGAGDATQLRLSALELRGTYATGSPPVDTDPPGLSAASVNGAALTLTYDEPLDGGSVPSAGAYAVLVNASGRAVTGAGVGGSVVTLTLASPVISTDTVSLSYTAPATNPVQDPAGNDAPAITGQAVTNATPPPGDTDPPGLSAASVNGAALRLTYDEPLDGGSVPSAGAYAVLVNASGRAVSGVGIAGSVVTLTLSSSVVSTDTVTVSYTAGTPPVQDVAGNDAPAFTSQAVTNATPPPGAGVNASGNEITDAVRAAAVQGDGRPADSSYGIWEAATNLDTNGGFENGTAAGWVAVGGGTVTGSTAQAKFGSRSGLVTASSLGDGASKVVSGLTASTSYSRSLWIYRTESSAILTVSALNQAGSGTIASTTAPAVLGWSRIVLLPTTQAGQTSMITRVTSDRGGVSWSIDGAQVERNVVATPYVETSGATATRGPSKVSVIGTPVGPTQGWVAVRIRFGFASTTNFARDPGIIDMSFADLDALFCYFDDDTDTFHFERTRSAAGSTHQTAAQTFSTGTIKTVIFAWTSAEVRVSVDGGAFTSSANTTIPNQATLYIGSDQVQGTGSDRQADSDYLWVAGGTGTLSNTDAATIHGFGNTDHAQGDFPGTATFAWAAN